MNNIFSDYQSPLKSQLISDPLRDYLLTNRDIQSEVSNFCEKFNELLADLPEDDKTNVRAGLIEVMEGAG